MVSRLTPLLSSKLRFAAFNGYGYMEGSYGTKSAGHVAAYGVGQVGASSGYSQKDDEFLEEPRGSGFMDG